MNLLAIRATGIAGIVGAICWAIGDVLLVGGSAPPEQFPLLLRDYADRIPFKALAWMLPLDESRLAAGAMIANLSIPLYLAGSWHLYQGVKPAGGILPFAAPMPGRRSAMRPSITPAWCTRRSRRFPWRRIPHC
jgi:hypothetical protein